MTDPRVAYASQVLRDFGRRCRANGVTMPPELAALDAWLATDRQGPTDVDPSEVDGHSLAVTYEVAAARLGVSKRTVEREVAVGRLPTVAIGGCRRIAVADMEQYVNGLRGAR